MGSLKLDWIGGLWKMGRSVWAKEDCSGSSACPPPLCSLPTWSSSSGCLQTVHIFPFTMFVSPGLCGGVQQLRLVDLHRHHLSYLLRTHTHALCLCLAIGELDFLSIGSHTLCLCLTTFKKCELECLIAGEMVADPSSLSHRMHICPLLSKWEWGAGDWKLSPNYIAKLVLNRFFQMVEFSGHSSDT